MGAPVAAPAAPRARSRLLRVLLRDKLALGAFLFLVTVLVAWARVPELREVR